METGDTSPFNGDHKRVASTQELEVKIAGLEHHIVALGQALTWMMTKLEQVQKSSIIGGTDTRKTFLQIYQEEIARIIEQQKAENILAAQEGANTVQ